MIDILENQYGTVEDAARVACEDAAVLQAVVDGLAAPRRIRQVMAAVLAAVAQADAQKLAPYAEQLVDALDCSEARTRWECLDALSEMVALEGRSCEAAIPEAEDMLFDEVNGQVRLSAMRFLCRLGASSPERSEMVWPLVDEGIQCFHGNPEFQEMLTAVTDFSFGQLAPDVAQALAARMAFDAENARGALKVRAIQIIENATR